MDTLVATTVAPKWSKTMLVGIDTNKGNDARLFVSVSTPFLAVPDSAIEVATRPRIDTFDFPCGVPESLDDDESHRFAFDVANIVVPKWPTRRKDETMCVVEMHATHVEFGGLPGHVGHIVYATRVESDTPKQHYDRRECLANNLRLQSRAIPFLLIHCH